MTIVSDGDPISTAEFPYVHFGWRLIYDGRPIARINASAGLAPAPGMIVAPSPDSEAMLPETLDRLIEKRQQGEADGRGEADTDADDRRFAGRLARYLLAGHSLAVYQPVAKVHPWPLATRKASLFTGVALPAPHP